MLDKQGYGIREICLGLHKSLTIRLFLYGAASGVQARLDPWPTALEKLSRAPRDEDRSSIARDAGSGLDNPMRDLSLP